MFKAFEAKLNDVVEKSDRILTRTPESINGRKAIGDCSCTRRKGGKKIMVE
ncbi:hypothetical protein ACWNPK_21310 [Bacillus atrophaeus]